MLLGWTIIHSVQTSLKIIGVVCRWWSPGGDFSVSNNFVIPSEIEKYALIKKF